ncbi:hypothetical protein SK128_023764, partial [Halocaridina rubra]
MGLKQWNSLSPENSPLSLSPSEILREKNSLIPEKQKVPKLHLNIHYSQIKMH